MVKAKGWARKHERCQECGTTERAHYARGLCGRCYMRLYKRRQRNTQREHTELVHAGQECLKG
jgi:uncharacterized paraquat-inducible protein A